MALSTNSVTNNGNYTVTVNFTVSSPNGISTGIFWGYNSSANSYADGVSSYSPGTYNITFAVSCGHTVYARVYDWNRTQYGATKTCSSGTCPIVPTVTTTTPATSGITATGATGGGNVTSAGYPASVTARGVCWNTSANPTIANSHSHNGTGTGVFTSSITGLTQNTLYHVRAYATNATGTAYGADIQFTTKSLPTVTITTITGATDVSMLVKGNVTLSGSSAVTARGICWGNINNPTIANSHTSNGSGLGYFTGTTTGLTYPNIYYVRAYATNSYGTGYSVQKSVMSLAGEVIYSGYTSNGTLIVPAGKNFANYLIVGGGGGGGNAKGSPPFAGAYAGGGGGGGLLRGIKHLKTTGGTFSIVVGSAGANNSGTGSNGGNSSAFGLIGYGGGFGAVAGDIAGYPSQDGGNGGNGGGGGSYETIGGTVGGSAIYGNQGHNGSNGQLTYPYNNGGGGGGYSTAGGIVTAGSGITLNYSGQLIIFAKGGAGGGEFSNNSGATGQPNTGVGGGGATNYVAGGGGAVLRNGGAGGSGVVYTLAGYNPWLMDTPTFTIINILSGCTLYAKATIAIPDFHNVGYYRLERSTTSGGTYSIIATGTTGGTHIIYDNTPVYGTSYWYKVVAVNQYLTEDSLPISISSTVTLPNSSTLNGVFSGSDINLSWTNANLFRNKTQIYRRDLPSATYNLKATVTGNTWTDTTIIAGHEYRYKIREEIDCFAPTYIYSPYSNEVNIYIDALLVAPTGCTHTDTCTGTTINWHNNNVSGQTGNYVKEFIGTGYTIIATLSSGATTYHITGLIPNTTHIYIIVAYNGSRFANSADINVITLNPAPFNINVVVSYLQAAVTWSINDPPYGTNIRPEIRVSGATNWTTMPLLAKNATSYTYTGLSFNTNYEGRIVRIGTEYPSIIFGFSTPTFKAPTLLTVTSIGDKQVCLSWQNNSVNDNIGVWVRESGYTWYNYATVSNVTNSICVTGLSMGTLYTFAVLNNYGIYSLSSNQVQATTTVSFIPSFCLHESYTVTGATCGNADGWIAIPHDATIFYNFTLTDISGNSYTLTDNFWSGLTASWYEITATVKPKWYYHYGAESCVLDWIKLPDINTTLTLTATKIKSAVCGGFGDSKGRIVYQFIDSNSGATSWTFSLYNEAHILVNVQHLTGITAIQYNSPSDIYYGILENNLGCVYLIDLTQVLAEKIWTVEGITDVYITPWTAGISYNYYSNSDDDWFVGTIDPLQFTSTKIKEFNGLTDFWYKINLVTAVASYDESLNKGSSGLVYNETFTLTIPHADNQKWRELVNILTKRYIIVFKDAQGLYWTLGYRAGTEVRSYQLSTNQYAISFISPSVSKMLTNLDELASMHL